MSIPVAPSLAPPAHRRLSGRFANTLWTQVSGVEVSEADVFPPLGRLVGEAGDTLDGETRLRMFEDEHGVQFLLGGLGRFLVEPDGRRIAYQLADDCLLQDVDHMVAGPVVGVAMQLFGRAILHASGMVVNGNAVAISAPGGSGKSTLAASFGRAGYPLIADDMLLLETGPAGWMARPYLPLMKLRDDSLSAFDQQPNDFSPALSWIEKRRVMVEDHWGSIASGVFPLRAVYLLDPNPEPTTEFGFTSLDGEDAVLRLVGATYLAEVLRGRRAINALDAAIGLAASVPVRVFSYHRSFENLPAIRQAILRDVEGIVGCGE